MFNQSQSRCDLQPPKVHFSLYFPAEKQLITLTLSKAALVTGASNLWEWTRWVHPAPIPDNSTCALSIL